jgi:hypothetical protein
MVALHWSVAEGENETRVAKISSVHSDAQLGVVLVVGAVPKSAIKCGAWQSGEHVDGAVHGCG